MTAPGGIAFVIDDAAAFVVDTGGPYFAGMDAPDESFHHYQFSKLGANFQLDWGRVGDGVVARIVSDKAVDLPLRLGSGWPGWASRFKPEMDGAQGEANIGARSVTWRIRTQAAPIRANSSELVIHVEPDSPARFVAGVGTLSSIGSVDQRLAKAKQRYESRRPGASGDWADFVGALANNMNNSRIYSSDNHRLAHSVSRGWANGDPNKAPYFCWDSFFTANLACLDDPRTAEDTVRAILSYQTSEGLVPNFAHWVAPPSNDRSQPPVGALCVWKMYERWGNKAFLKEVYPKLAKWHEWWPKARDGNHDGLLEWGTATGDWQNAQYETGWDDNLHFAGTKMAGASMDANAIDLNSLWSMDAEYLARMARVLGHKDDAAHFGSEHEQMNRRINEKLWNEKLGMYCSRLWNGEFLTRLTPMNFYPLIAGAPDATRAGRVMAVLTDSHKFWGTWVLPTLAYDDPDYHQQEYWRGDIWAPVNYLMFQGLKRYATPAQRMDYAQKCVALFMNNWKTLGVCGENYLSTDGTQNRDPHYTWGGLLNLIGIENLYDIGSDGKIEINNAQVETVDIKHLPIQGRLWELRVTPGRTELLREGKGF